MIRNKTRGIQRKPVQCPECGAERIINWRAGVRRFRARHYRCLEDDCDFIAPRSAWDDPYEWHA